MNAASLLIVTTIMYLLYNQQWVDDMNKKLNETDAKNKIAEERLRKLSDLSQTFQSDLQRMKYYCHEPIFMIYTSGLYASNGVLKNIQIDGNGINLNQYINAQNVFFINEFLKPSKSQSVESLATKYCIAVGTGVIELILFFFFCNRCKILVYMKNAYNMHTEPSTNCDPFTGLQLKAMLSQKLLEICNDNTTPAAFISLDMDNMKRLNEKGHHIADNVIQSIAIILKHMTENRGIYAYRNNSGGDEFGLIIMNRNETQIKALAENLRKEIDDSTIATISMGIAVRKHNETKETWFARAEKALAMAKGKGKNRWSMEN